jgi:hypothetical protein
VADDIKRRPHSSLDNMEWKGIREETRYENNGKQVHYDFIRVNNLGGFSLAAPQRGWNTGPPRCVQVSHWRGRGTVGSVEARGFTRLLASAKPDLAINTTRGRSKERGVGQVDNFCTVIRAMLRLKTVRQSVYFGVKPHVGPMTVTVWSLRERPLTTRRDWKCLLLCLSFNAV